jgi:hypothetical protein
MPAVHIRDVPDDVLATLRELAHENNRSFNAEVVAALEERARLRRQRGEATRRIAEIAGRIRIPPGFPTPEELIRAGRDSG